MNEQVLMTKDEVADRLRVSVCTVDRLLRAGDLPRVTVGLRSVRVPAAAVADYLGRITGKGVAA